MGSLVQIDDHLRGVRISLPFASEDRSAIVSTWSDPDALLGRLQGMAAFRGKLALGDLGPGEFRILIAMHLGLLGDVPERHAGDRRHTVVKSLHRLLLGLLIVLEGRLEGQIPLLTINRIAPRDLTYTVTAVLDRVAIPSFTGPTPFRVVVDNS